MAYLLWHYLADSARRHPERPAVASREGSLTYRELDELSRRIAAVLAAHGIGRGARVGMLMPKQFRSVAVMLGVLRTGAAYVPVDPHVPARRGAFILVDCGVRALFTTRAMLVQLREHAARLSVLETVILVDQDSGTAVAWAGVTVLGWQDLARAAPFADRPDMAIESDPAYLLYTSGSTGNPKGVILTHRNALTFVEWSAKTFGVGPDDRMSNHAPLHFDLSVFDIYVALRCGACAVMVPDRLAPFPMELARWIEQEAITIWYSVPSALTRLLLHGGMERFAYERLRNALFAGEVFPVKYLRGVMERMRGATFFNLYGPTETNVCTYYRVPRPLPEDATEIPIGRACENTEVFVLTEQERSAGAGETGELLVRGPTVAPGYWGLPERSRAVLVQDPRQQAFDERVYRTGDLVRVDASGDLWFAGRKDHMVKARGYRIELGEIEQALYAHEGVREAVVIPVPDEEIGARLLAFVAPHSRAELSEAGLHSFLAARLPRYMVPESIVLRDELPHTSTGKTDRQALACSIA